MDKAFMIIKLIPAVIALIKTVEEMFPLPQAGGEKLALVKEMLTVTYGNLEDIWPKLEAIVEALVKFANKVGIFKK